MRIANMPLFSIITPVFNRPAMLAEAMQSVLAQRCTDWEMIIVNDGSTDDTAKALAELERQYGKQCSLKVIHQTNTGQALARNAGIGIATGQYVAFLDSDDLWFSWTLDVFRKAIEQFDSPSVLCGNPHGFRGLLPVLKEPQSQPEFLPYADFLEAFVARPFWIGAGGLAVRRSLLQEVGGFSPVRHNGEDNDLFLKLGTAPGFVLVRQPPTFACRSHGGNDVDNLASSVRGLLYIIGQELAGAYSGGDQRLQERRKQILICINVCMERLIFGDRLDLAQALLGRSLDMVPAGQKLSHQFYWRWRRLWRVPWVGWHRFAAFARIRTRLKAIKQRCQSRWA